MKETGFSFSPQLPWRRQGVGLVNQWQKSASPKLLLTNHSEIRLLN